MPINVSVNPSEFSGRSIRLGNPDTSIRDKMNQRMQEFEDESRKWREQFLSTTSNMSPQPSLLDHRPRMFVNFPEFPELGSSFGSPLSRMSNANPSTSSFFPAPLSQASHKSFIEEDDHGSKKYKMTFEIGDFKPTEIQVKTEGRQLIVKGDREFKAGSAVESKQFNREITLPDFVEPTSVISFLSDGVLTVEAPVLVDRLDYQPNSSLNPSAGASPASTLRNSPFRDNSSPSRSIFANSSNSSRASRDNMLNSATSLASHSTFNSPLYSDLPSNPIIQVASSSASPTNNGVVNQPAIYKFNMSEFRPEDISITVTDTSLKIHAVREENDVRGGGKSYREFKREIGLPQGADVKRLKNSLQSDGTLYIEIPVQDNSNFRPPLSPTGINKSFNNLTLNENANHNSSNSNSSTMTSNNSSLSSSGNVVSSASAKDHSTKDALIDQTNTGKELRLTFDLTGYKPEDLSVKVIDNNTLKVHAVHIDNSRGNQIHREYTRQYILPEWVQPELLRARMSDDGTLTVEIPVPQVQPSKYERVINIQNSNR